MRASRVVSDDHTVSWEGQRWGVCAGLRRARVEIERRLDVSHWLRFRGRYLPLHRCPNAPRSVSPSGEELRAGREHSDSRRTCGLVRRRGTRRHCRPVGIPEHPSAVAILGDAREVSLLVDAVARGVEERFAP